MQNIESFGLGQSSSSNPQLQGTENFRFSLWSKIYDEQKSSSHLVDGFGFGPNLANIGGVSASKSQTQTLSLRSAHNSPLDVFARTGIVGGTLWLFMFLGWFRRMWHAHRRYRVDGNEADRGLIDFCMLGTIAIIINSIFDPTLKGTGRGHPVQPVRNRNYLCEAPRPWTSSTHGHQGTRPRARRAQDPCQLQALTFGSSGHLTDARSGHGRHENANERGFLTRKKSSVTRKQPQGERHTNHRPGA